ncbi:hypothetical protein IID24_01755 [Patescibacteria group bacterium]|nr:hypothetical protein [Patescibacteria group bacterium]
MSTQRNTLWFTGGSVIIILLFGGFVTYPIMRGIIDDHQQVFLQKQDLALIGADTKNVEQFQRSFAVYNVELERLSDLFIDQIIPIEFIKFLEQLAENHQLDLTVSLGVPKKAQGDPWPSIGFNLTLRGSYANTLKVLEKIENAPYLVELESMQMTGRVQGVGLSTQLNTLVGLKVYAKEIPEIE